MPTSALCKCISFSLVLYFFKTLNSSFIFECPTYAILQRVSKTVADQWGGLPPYFSTNSTNQYTAVNGNIQIN